jgi:hypothetical protein
MPVCRRAQSNDLVGGFRASGWGSNPSTPQAFGYEILVLKPNAKVIRQASFTSKY